MGMPQYRYLYGPVASWRLGSSLGIDPISASQKICTYDCTYCQLGRTHVFTDKRREFVAVEGLIREIEMLPSGHIDFLTFSGRGEPTLANNLGKMIRAIKEISSRRIAVITNASLMDRTAVCEDLNVADYVLAKFDTSNLDTFWAINRPMRTIQLNNIFEALKNFKFYYKGKFALQIMFTALNIDEAVRLAHCAKEIAPDEIQINTPLRPCAEKPIGKDAMLSVVRRFHEVCGKEIPVMNVYERGKEKIRPFSWAATTKRRGKI